MSTSLLYHGFGVRGYAYVRTEYVGGEIAFTVRQDRRKLRCAVCGCRRLIRRGEVTRRFRTPPIGSKHTRAFERYALDLSRRMTIKDVARHLGVSWDLIKDVQKRHLKKRFSRPRLKNLRRIAIDEITIGKHHDYLTVVLDLYTGAWSSSATAREPGH